MDLVSRRHLTKDVDLTVIIIILVAAMRIHVILKKRSRIEKERDLRMPP